MDIATCNIIYVDRGVRHDTQLAAESTDASLDVVTIDSPDLRANLSLLVDTFSHVYACATGAACIEKLLQLHDTSTVELKPTLVLIDIPHDDHSAELRPASRDLSPHSRGSSDDARDGDAEIYGLRLLEKVVYETHSRNLSRLVVPVPVVSFSPLPNSSLLVEADDQDQTPSQPGTSDQPLRSTSRSLNSRALVRQCLDSGAGDVLVSPLRAETLASLEVHAYRAHKEALKEQQALLEIRRGRKRSWVGVHEEKPFAYLREAMVSGLMGGICRPGAENDAGIGSVRLAVSSEQRAEVAEAIGRWHFDAHVYGDDQLVIAASLMFKHALSMPELAQWRIPTDQLTTFLVACRAAYNTFVPYHNFRHAVDVLQATFNFLVNIGALPPYSTQPSADTVPVAKSPLAALLKPFEALTLLISAIGHDVGHPGVNNGFLVVLNAPLAQLYNDRSVLESFHCAAYSQILRRYWPKVFENTKMRSLMISSILATDMGLHFDYMAKLSSLQERLHENNSTEGWNYRTIETETALACALLIKCADISNVARRYDSALKWMHILCDEFSRQAGMENEIGIPSSLISEPKKDFLSLAKAQLGFMNLFAIPLFQNVADVLPMMQYTVKELEGNKALFENAIEDLPEMEEQRRKALLDGALSPRSMSIAIAPEASQDSSSNTTISAPQQPTPENQAKMKAAGSSPPDQPQQIPNMPGQYKEINGVSGDFEDFHIRDGFDLDDGENRVIGHNGKQRCSETTEGSNSVPCSGDWASQATSATTGKMPLSPSTQGTSIISQESVERRYSVPATTVTAPEVDHLVPPLPPMEPDYYNDSTSNGSTLKSDRSPSSDKASPPDKSLKKKPSRFRMNALKLFRRDRNSHSPSSGGECGG